MRWTRVGGIKLEVGRVYPPPEAGGRRNIVEHHSTWRRVGSFCGATHRSQRQRKDGEHMTDKKVWLITGAGHGMGVDIAKAALAAGSAVVATGRRPEAV